MKISVVLLALKATGQQILNAPRMSTQYRCFIYEDKRLA